MPFALKKLMLKNYFPTENKDTHVTLWICECKYEFYKCLSINK